MMSSLIHIVSSKQTCFEDLPDEILLLICRYLSPINVFDSVLNLNRRLNKTITSYREKIVLSHLSRKDFYHLIENHLPYLASNVRCLYINSRSMLNIGNIFERKFDKIDQQFPLLDELIFNQIDIETLENLSWRFSSMHFLRQLTIDIAEDRLLSMPVQFDEFLCGKLFSVSNSFGNLKLNLNNYQFSLHSLNHKCTNIRHLTISVKHLNDLFIIFDSLPNIEQLDITIDCSSPYNTDKDTYQYEHLWWKVPVLTKFQLTIQEKGLTSHNNVIPNDIVFKIVTKLYSLLQLKFTLIVKFNLVLEESTTKDFHLQKYLPYADGSLWQKALERNDNRTIRFGLHIELDGIVINRSKIPMESDVYFEYQNTETIFKSLIKSTFSNAYWLEKSIAIQCYSTATKHLLIYTIPITSSSLSTTVNVIDKEISVKSSPSHLSVQSLHIYSDPDVCSSNLSITNLFTKFPYLTDLIIDAKLTLPPTISVCSYRLRSLSLRNYSLISCCQLLDYLPQLISLSLTSSSGTLLLVDSCPKPTLSITRLTISIDSLSTIHLSHIIKYFPNVNEFYLIIKNVQDRLFDDVHQFDEFECFSQGFTHLRYIQITLPTKHDSLLFSHWMLKLIVSQGRCAKTTDGNSLTLKAWF